MQPYKWIVVPSTASHFGAHCLNFRNVTHNNPNARVNQCLQSWLGSWAPTRAWWLFFHPGVLWTHCSFGKKKNIPSVLSQCKPENEEGGPRDAVQKWDLCFSLQEMQHFLQIAVVLLESGGRKAALAGLVPAAWEGWGMLVSGSSPSMRVIRVKGSVCLCWTQCKECWWNGHWPSKLLLPLSPDHSWKCADSLKVWFSVLCSFFPLCPGFPGKWSWITGWALSVRSGSDS